MQITAANLEPGDRVWNGRGHTGPDDVVVMADRIEGAEFLVRVLFRDGTAMTRGDDDVFTVRRGEPDPIGRSLLALVNVPRPHVDHNRWADAEAWTTAYEG